MTDTQDATEERRRIVRVRAIRTVFVNGTLLHPGDEADLDLVALGLDPLETGDAAALEQVENGRPSSTAPRKRPPAPRNRA